MRIPSGTTDQYVYFVAVDSTDFTTRETGLTTFTVYRSRNGAAAAAMTTPTINETDATNMPGVYELLLDEDMTIAAGNTEEEMVFHITQASMAPVTRSITLFRPVVTEGNTLGVAATGDISGNIDGNVDGSVASVTAAVTTGTISAGAIDAAAIATGAIDADAIASNAITNAKIAADAIGASEIANGAIDAATFAAGAIDATAIAANAITNAKIAASAITPAEASVNISQISGDATAADNLELAYDGTGYAGGTTKQQVDVVSLATDVITAAALSAGAVTEITDDIMAEVIESQGSYTVQQALSICLSVLAGVTSSSGNTIATPDGVATRVAATTNGSNERTAMTLTPSS